MELNIKDLTERIRKGESLESIHYSTLWEDEREILKRCAVVRMFNEPMVDTVFRWVRGGKIITKNVPFERIVKHDFVEQVPRKEGWFRLKDSARIYFINSWEEKEPGTGYGTLEQPFISKDLKEFCRKMVDYFESMGSEFDKDKLYHLALSDPDEAITLFRRLYKEADDDFDLTRCYDMLRVLDDRNDTLGLAEELAKVVSDFRLYFGVRSLWMKEYYQTARYYQRNELSAHFEALLSSPGKWIFNLYARGGMGKTMFIRWLISRRCVPFSNRIPCARLDFDFVDPLILSQKPWLLFFKMAEQLNEQIPGAPFVELLKELRDYTYEQVENISISQKERLIREIPDRFISTLCETAQEKTIILVMDTLEEVIFQREESLLEVIEQIELLHKKLPGACLVLSGRYDPRKRMKGFTEKYDSVTESFEIKPFKQEEAQHYLMEKRGFSDKELIKAVMDRSEGNPFKLSLFADIIRETPGLTASDIRAYPRVDLAYLIERVVERISNGQVRWVLRYGVIPRRLNRQYLEEVMAQYLPPVMSGNAQYDDPQNNIPTQLRKDDLFRTDLLTSPQDKVDLDELWRLLNQYADRYSWVSAPGDVPDTLVFHGDVVNPMRFLVRPNEIFYLLHQDSIAYFERKAEAEPDNWCQWICEAIYHKFQLEGSAASDYWQNHLNRAKEISDLRAWHDIAIEVLGSAYIDEDGSPRQGDDGTPIILWETLAVGYYEAAMALMEIDIKRKKDTSSQYNIDRYFSKAADIEKKINKQIIPPTARVRLQAAQYHLLQNPAEALAVLENTLKGELTPKDRMILEMDYAGFLTSEEPERKSYHLRKAKEILDKLDTGNDYFLHIRFTIARQIASVGKLEEAEHQLETLFLKAKSNADVKWMSEVTTMRGQLNLEMGRLSIARHLIMDSDFFNQDQLDILGPHLRIKYYLAVGEVYLAFEYPFKAMKSFPFQPLLKDWEDDNLEYSAAHKELLGRALSRLMVYPNAMEQLEGAIRLWLEAGEPGKAARCLHHMIRLQLREIGNLREALSSLERAEKISTGIGIEWELQYRLLRSEYLALADKMEEARDNIREAKILFSKKMTPELGAAISLEELILNAQENPREYLEKLIEALSQIQPASARIHLFKRLAQCPVLGKTTKKLKQNFKKLIPLSPGSSDEFPIFALVAAEGFRIIGEKEQAIDLLREAENRFLKRENLFGVLVVFNARSRLGWEKKDFNDETYRLLLGFLEENTNYPLFQAQKYRELAEICLTVEDIERAEYTYKKAEALLANQSYSTKVQAENVLLGAKLSRVLGKTETQMEFLTKARNIYEALGDIRSYKSLDSQLKLESIDTEIKKQQYFLLRINRASGQNIEVTTGFTDRGTRQQKINTDEKSILREIFDEY